MTAQLVRELETHTATLTKRVVSEMYRDPFWSARFGERGRKFSEEDGQSHISHLVQALVAGDPEVLARYGCWLRSVLTTRGMCTRHLLENFERLEWAMRDLDVDVQPAVDYLRAARAALQAELAAAEPLARASEQIASSVCSRLASGASGGWRTAPTKEDDQPSPELLQQLSSLVSFLVDALVLGRSQYLLAHVRWLDSWLGREPEGAGQVARLLSGLGHHLAEDVSLPAALRSGADTLLREALAALGSQPGAAGSAS